MNTTNVLGLNPLSLSELQTLFLNPQTLQFSPEVSAAIEASYNYLQAKVGQTNRLFYGINTGFGSLCNVAIEKEDLSTLQHNLIMSHACGTGDLVPQNVVRLMLLLKIKNLSLGYSAVQPSTAERMLFFYNQNILPVVYQQGSLGASGDLAPLAHLSLPLIGKGEVYYQNQKQPTEQLLAQSQLQPLRLAMKEGLALLNGTQFCLAYGISSYWKAEKLSKLADLCAAISIDAFDCRLSPFNHLLHQIRPHQGQIETAKNILAYLQDSPLAAQDKTAVQDPYSFRCVPQVHGASKDALRYVMQVLETELNSVTDNPTVFVAEDEILSGGNFHAQPLALALDFLALALSELANISERRIYQLIGGLRGLPPFLTKEAGLNSGMMILQYTAASIVSQNKQLCTPASVDNIVSCAGQEDHVSMASNAATKLWRIAENVERVLAIEFLVANQALNLRAVPSSPTIQNINQRFRTQVDFLHNDRVLYEDIQKSLSFIQTLF